MPFVVVGTWGSSRGDKVVHQETIHDDSLRPKYDAITCIQYTDGTVLYVETYDIMHPPQKLGYKSLLDNSVRQGLTGTFSVMDVK
jgi:hypothetical protein